MRSALRLVTLAAAASLLCGPAGAFAAPPEQGGPVYLPWEADGTIRVNGDGPDNSAAGAGDVNGDGLADLIVSGPFYRGGVQVHGAYVIFGRASPFTIDLGSLASIGPGGFFITGPEIELPGSAVATAGDVNGDGLADVMVGARGASHNGRIGSGSVYIVYGKRDPGTIDLAALGSHGTRIDGEQGFQQFGPPGDSVGGKLAPVGDVNGDGYSDVVVSSDTRGLVWVVFGSSSGAPVDLAALGARGFRMDPPFGGVSDIPATGVGDFNGDGRPDVYVATPPYLHVVFGKADSAPVDLSDPGDGALRITDLRESFTSSGGAGAGDVNFDGLADLIVALPGARIGGVNQAGAVEVVFGRRSTATFDIADPGFGFRIEGFEDNAHVGSSVAGPGDFNGDGRPDVLVGAQQQPRPGCRWCGAAFGVYGKASETTISLASLGSAGFRMDGSTEKITGYGVSKLGDMNGDGAADMLVLSSGQPQIGGSDSAVFVLFGFGVGSARERVQRLADAVRELAVAGELPRVRAVRLVARLVGVVSALDAGREPAAIRRLRRFAMRVTELGTTRLLVLADALVVARAAERIAKELEAG